MEPSVANEPGVLTSLGLRRRSRGLLQQRSRGLLMSRGLLQRSQGFLMSRGLLRRSLMNCLIVNKANSDSSPKIIIIVSKSTKIENYK